MMKSVKTEKGTELPLVNLKGKAYLMVAYRLQWFNERESNFDIVTELVSVTDDQTIARATVTVMDKDGKVLRKAMATKRETKKDFSDHTEKAETAAVGRALAMLGYGTQFALADLDEGDRIVDTPVTDVKAQAGTSVSTDSSTKVTTAVGDTSNGKFQKSSFKKKKETKAVTETVSDENPPEGWN